MSGPTLESRARSSERCGATRGSSSAWCSAFANWCVEKAGYEGTDSAWAKSWLTWGKKLATPRRGCIAVFTRGDGGHVGFYISKTSSVIKVLGGNQSDEVNIS